MAFEEKWAKTIRGRAAELGLNQADIGRALGMSKQTGHRIWKGAHRLTVDQCDELAEALVLDADELRVLCGYLPEGEDPKVEKTENGITVRLSTLGLHLLVITWSPGEEADHRAGDWFPRPIDIHAKTARLAA